MYIVYHRYRLGEPEASEAAMTQQRQAVDLLISWGHEVEAEYIEFEAASAGEAQLEPRPKLRMAFEHVARLRANGSEAQLAILRIAAIGSGNPFDWINESARTEADPIVVLEQLDALGEAGELLRRHRGIIDPDWGFECELQQIAAEDYFRRKKPT